MSYGKKYKKTEKVARYKNKFLPGKHYVVAHNAIAHPTIGIIGVEDNGDISGSGMIAKIQVKELRNRGVELREDDFVLSYNEFEQYCSDYQKLKDEYIEENKIPLEYI